MVSMEIINIIKDVVIKVIWGDFEVYKELVFGCMGNIVVGELYDVGNIELIFIVFKIINFNLEVEFINIFLKIENMDEVVINVEFNKNVNFLVISVEFFLVMFFEKFSVMIIVVIIKDDVDFSKLDINFVVVQLLFNILGDLIYVQNDICVFINLFVVYYFVGEIGKFDVKKNVDDSGDGVDKFDNFVKIDGFGL